MKNLIAIIDFGCLSEGCHTTVSFNIMQLKDNDNPIKCSECYQQYQFTDEAFISKLEKLKHLLFAINAAEDILDDCSVGVKTLTEEVLIPYKLLLARLNANINIDIEGTVIPFNFRLEPLNEEQTIR